MGEQDGPPVADPLVEIDPAFRAVRGEVGSFAVDSQRHDSPPCRVNSSYMGYPWDIWASHPLPASPTAWTSIKYLRVPRVKGWPGIPWVTPCCESDRGRAYVPAKRAGDGRPVRPRYSGRLVQPERAKGPRNDPAAGVHGAVRLQGRAPVQL